jgi:sialic acid synthase
MASSCTSSKTSSDNKPTIEIAPGVEIGGDNPCFVIAEFGVNHLGDVNVAKELILLAKQCGADCVKGQKRTVDRILCKEGLERPYTGRNSFGATYGEHKRFLEFSDEEFIELKEYADELGILFTASGWDEPAVDFLDSIGVPFFKMASADLTNFPLLEHVAKKGKPMIVSTGMADMTTVVKAYEHVRQFTDKIVLLQCTSTYPCQDPSEINLNVMQTYREQFPDAVVGYSGHESGLQISIAAATLGAKVIERHFTKNRTWRGSDQAASLEKAGLEKLIRDIRVIESALGDGVKRMNESERPCFVKLSKSCVSAVPIVKGSVIDRQMVTTKGPGKGISPMYIDLLVGARAAHYIEPDTILYAEDFEGLELPID